MTGVSSFQMFFKEPRSERKSRTGRIWSEKFKTVSTNGIHVATQVGELVFDNFYPDGIPVAEWQRDMGADMFEDLSMSQEEFGAPECIDD